MAGIPGASGGHNRLSAQQHALKGTYRRDRHGDLTPGKALADVEMCPEHLLGDDTEALWHELAGRYDQSVEPLRVENAALAQAIVRRAYKALAAVPIADAGRVLRLIAKFSDLSRAQLTGLRPVEQAAAPPEDPFREFDMPEGAQ